MDIFQNLSFDRFKELARMEGISDAERVGFPTSYRQGKEIDILSDIFSKISNLHLRQQNFLEIGPGSSALTDYLIQHCKDQDHKITFVDSEEMLNLIPYAGNMTKICACFPREYEAICSYGPYDAILIYSVLQYPFAEGNVWDFVDKACSLLAPGGQLLLGDIPNISMRKRFFASEAGIKCHQEFTKKSNDIPEVHFNVPEPSHIDDGFLIGLISRLRNFGFHAFLMPQTKTLPMSSRREDLLIIKP